MNNDRIFLIREKEKEVRKIMDDLYSVRDYRKYLEQDEITWRDVFEDIVGFLLIAGLIIIMIAI